MPDAWRGDHSNAGSEIYPGMIQKTLAVTWTLAIALLVSVGVLRPHLPATVRGQWPGVVIGLAALAAAALAAEARRRRPTGGYIHGLTAIFALVLAAMYLQPQRVASDGIFYFAPLRSLVVDGDLDFENEYRVLGAPEGYFQRTATGRLPNHFSIGPAMVWAPFYVWIHGLGKLGCWRPTGFGYAYFTAVATATALAGFLGVCWTFALARIYFEPRFAFVATLLLWSGSFLLWYMVFEPSMSHAPAMAAVAGFLLLSHREPTGLGSFAILGLAAGAVVLMRWQNVVFLPVGLAVAWGKRRPSWSGVATGALVALVVFAPQSMFWKLLYDRFVLVPQGGGYLQWGSPQFESVLFSSRHGLFSWSPVLWIGAFGFVRILTRAPRLGVSSLGAFFLALVVNASVHDWWAGASFGARRFDGALPLFGIGLAAAVDWLDARARDRPLVVVSLLLLPFSLWSLLLMGLAFDGAVPFDGPVSFRQAAADGLDAVYRVTGYPFSWPGALAENLRRGVPFSAYDLAGARHLANQVDIRMGDNDALYLGRGWSLPRRQRERTLREGSPDGAFLYVALREPATYQVGVEGQSDVRLRILVNRRIMGEIRLEETSGSAIMVPPDLLISGVNEMAFHPSDGGGFSVSRVSWKKLATP